MDDERWRGLRTLFDGVAERYDAARPRYPRVVVDDLVALAGLESGSRVLEIGCGTGQLTVDLARRGLDVTAVEIGPALAVARRNLAPYSHPRNSSATLVAGAGDADHRPNARRESLPRRPHGEFGTESTMSGGGDHRAIRRWAQRARRRSGRRPRRPLAGHRHVRRPAPEQRRARPVGLGGPGLPSSNGSAPARRSRSSNCRHGWRRCRFRAALLRCGTIRQLEQHPERRLRLAIRPAKAGRPVGGDPREASSFPIDD